MPQIVPDADVRAAEYVIGLMDPADIVRFEREAREDQDAKLSLNRWLEDFSVLNAGYAAKAAPKSYPVIERRLFGLPFGRRAARPLPGWMKWAAVGVAAVVIAVKATLIVEIVGYLLRLHSGGP